MWKRMRRHNYRMRESENEIYKQQQNLLLNSMETVKWKYEAKIKKIKNTKKKLQNTQTIHTHYIQKSVRGYYCKTF